MAFWGIELKPGKPYTHLYESNRGRLRISQATLGHGNSTKRSLVQCNVGSKSPVLLCSLLPDKVESCLLDLEFKEDEEVIFSAVGPGSIHLTGYYPGPGSSGDETDSYGEDIAETESEFGSYDSEDEYEADFIDDSDTEMFPPSPRPNSGVIIEEIVDDVKPTNGIANRRQLKKKHQVKDCEDDAGSQQQIIVKHNRTPVLESEDEDGLPISLPTEIGSDGNEKSKKKKKEKVKVTKSFNTQANLSTEKMEEKASQDQNHDGDDKMDGVKVQSLEGQTKNVDEDLAGTYEVDGVERSGKLKKKMKERIKKGEIIDASVGLSTEETSGRDNEDQNQPINEDEEPIIDNMDQDQSVRDVQEKVPNGMEIIASSVPSGAALESSRKLNKKNKKRRTVEGISQEGNYKSADTLEKDGRDKSQIMEDNLVIDEIRHPEPEENAHKEEMDQKLSVTELPNEESSNVGVNPPAKKKRKKKSKIHENDSITNEEKTDLVGAEGKTKPGKGTTEVKDEVRTPKTRTFPNGLAIEELRMGKPDGRRASPGNKVYVHYIGKLQNGKIFDSNIGQRPFKFRLGIGEVIKGWDVGVNGMRIGDKRRLTIPPSMGYGSKGAGKIPGNAWLVFDVELIDVQ